MLNFVPMQSSKFNTESKCSISSLCSPPNLTPSQNAQFCPSAVLLIQHRVKMLNFVPLQSSKFNTESKCSISSLCSRPNLTPSQNAQFRPSAVLQIQHP